MAQDELVFHMRSSMDEKRGLRHEIEDINLLDHDHQETVDLAFRYAVATFRFAFHGSRLLERANDEELPKEWSLSEEIERLIGNNVENAERLSSKRATMFTVIQAAKEGDYRLLKRFIQQEGMDRYGERTIQTNTQTGLFEIVPPWRRYPWGMVILGTKLNRLAFLMPDTGEPLEIPQVANS